MIALTGPPPEPGARRPDDRAFPFHVTNSRLVAPSAPKSIAVAVDRFEENQSGPPNL